MRYYRIFKPVYQAMSKKMRRHCQGFIKEGSKILDLGCGSGITTREFENFFKADITGIDIKEQRIENVPFRLFDGEKIPFPNNFFDAVLIAFVLHHSADPISLLKEAKRVAKEKIIIYEDLAEGFLSRLVCKLHGASYNYFFQKNGERTNFKKDGEWKEIFQNLRLNPLFEKRTSSIINPVKKKLFILEKI